MSQSQSFSGKVCFRCSKANFILNNGEVSYTNSSASVQTDTYTCPKCELKIKHRFVQHLSNNEKVQEVIISRNP
ncbi:MAG TPA: hypothetical protein VL854_13900, partial [Nitrososphaeraceae archaeon]|nr:hypothetical protein [Nitrososphaeraceae archaeon]